MGLRFIVGHEQGTEDLGHEIAVLWDSVTETAFGHTFRAAGPYSALEVGQKFLDWCEKERGIKDGDLRPLPIVNVLGLQEEYEEEVERHL